MALEPLSADDPGEVGGYRLAGRLGAGGMGRVYLAYTPGGRPVALKVVRPEFGDDPDFRHRFRREVQASRQVHGLYTAQVLDADPDAAQPWLVTAYVPGPSLYQAVIRHGPLPQQTALLLMAGVAEAVQAIHAAGLVHRDLKPSNVLLAPDGPRVIDFGIARAIAGSAVTRTGMLVGSPQYMAPEQIADRPLSAAIDVFATGALIAYAVSGRSPFGEGSDPAVLYRIVHEPASLDGCPEPLRALIARCLAKEPARRPAPSEIIRTCRAASAGQTLQIGGFWLPPAVAADFGDGIAAASPAPARRGPAGAAPAPADLRPPAGYGQPGNGPGGYARAGPRPAGYQPAGYGAGGRGPAGSARPERPPDGYRPPGFGSAGAGRNESGPPAARTPGSGQANGPLAGRTAPMGGGLPDAPRRGSFGKSVLVAVLAAIVVVVMGGLLAQRHGPGGQNATASSGRPRGQQAGQTSARASCLVGTWAGVTENVINHISGQPVSFTGRGANQVLRANGTGLTDYGRYTDFTATIGGNRWDYVVSGWATFTWTTQHGQLLIGGVVPHGTWVLRKDGAYNNSGTLALSATPERYACSPRLLRAFISSGSVVLRRQ